MACTKFRHRADYRGLSELQIREAAFGRRWLPDFYTGSYPTLRKGFSDSIRPAVRSRPGLATSGVVFRHFDFSQTGIHLPRRISEASKIRTGCGLSWPGGRGFRCRRRAPWRRWVLTFPVSENRMRRARLVDDDRPKKRAKPGISVECLYAVHATRWFFLRQTSSISLE